MKQLVLIVGILILGFLAVFLPMTKKNIQPGGQLRVLTTFLPLYVFTQNVAGQAAIVENLLPNGVGPHGFVFSPAEVKKISQAQLVIKQGIIDDWVDKILAAADQADLPVVTAGQGILPHTGAPRFDLEARVETNNFSAGLLERPKADDPHQWLDPFLAVQEVERIRDGLMLVDPDNREIYARQAEAYILKLLALDQEIRLALEKIKSREFVSFHPAFRYFAYEYGLREVGAIKEIPDQEPTPIELGRLVRQIQGFGVRAIFSEPQFSPKIVEILARDYGLRIVELDPLETGEFRADYYEEVMRKNVKAIVSALN